MPERGGLFEEKDRAGVGRQIVLPWSKAFEISMKSLKIRFWRSMITMSGIILAIAFLMSIWTSNAFLSSFKIAVLEEQGEGAAKSPPPKTVDSQENEQAEEPIARLRKALTKQKEDLEETGLSAKDIWLVVLSLLVCVVGIVNAMLMSVTERIREIGTMKCLGALNGFIVKLFLLESSLQGIAGTAIGIILGFILTFLRTYVYYGGATVAHFPGGGIAFCALMALLVGSFLSVFAAIFPAYRAAGMQPVDAMRVEE